MHQEEHETLLLRSRSSDYSCVAMVFANRRTWVDDHYVNLFLEEDGYRKVGFAQAKRGDVVVYRTREGRTVHVGLVVEHRPVPETASWTTTVLSQWGLDGEFFHDVDDVPPLFGDSREVWTERT